MTICFNPVRLPSRKFSHTSGRTRIVSVRNSSHQAASRSAMGCFFLARCSPFLPYAPLQLANHPKVCDALGLYILYSFLAYPAQQLSAMSHPTSDPLAWRSTARLLDRVGARSKKISRLLLVRRGVAARSLAVQEGFLFTNVVPYTSTVLATV